MNSTKTDASFRSPPPAVWGRTPGALAPRWLAGLLVLTLCLRPTAAAEYVVDFEDGSKGAYASGSVTLNGVSWTLSEALIGSTATDWKNGSKSARLRGYTASALTMNADKADGIGAVSFQHRRYGTDTQVPWRVEVSTNAGADWAQVGADFTPGAAEGSFSATVNQATAARIRVRAVNAGTADRRANVDDILLTDFGASASNRPPVLAPVADQSIGLNEPLSFLVQATDPDGTDEVTLWATNLPTVASFVPATGLGAASNVCAWTDTSTGGLWTVTFYAADKDGTNSRSVTVEIAAAGVASDLIVSEYGEGSSNNKYIELFNGTGRSIELSGYSLRKSVNGAPTFTDNLSLAGLLPHNDTYVIVYGAADPALLAKGDLSTRSNVMTFSGNDPVALFKGADPLDVVGDFGDVNFGGEVTLIRLSNVTSPTNVYTSAQWTSFGQNTWTDVGRHAMDGVESMRNFPPVFASVPAQQVSEGAALGFQVSATDAVDEDEILLYATALPLGATFVTVSNLAAVSSTFEWVNASPAGVYTSRFAAVDGDGTSTLSVVVSVLPVLPSNQTLVVHFNEVRYNDAGDDDAEFIELIAHAGEELGGCTLVHYNGSPSSDGGIWTFTFPAFTVPDDGIIDTNGVACGFVLLSQTGGALAAVADFLLPVDPASTNVPKASMQNGPDGLVLYDSGGAVLDAVVWGTFSMPGDTGDLLVDDPGPAVLTRNPPTTASTYLHLIQPGSDDNSPQAPDNVIGDTGQNWTVLHANPGALNFGQTDGLLILTPQYPPPPPTPTGLLMVIW